MTWFNRSRKKQDDAHEEERITREVGELFDSYDERATVIEGDKVILDPQQVLANIHDRMERADLDPDTAWAPQDLMSMDETLVMFDGLGLGELVVTQTAWYARQILARWPAEIVEIPIPPQVRIEMLLHGPKVDPVDEDIARAVMNRALASADRVKKHPEIDGLDSEKLVQVWIAVVFWFAIKSEYMHRRDRGDVPE